MGLEALNNVKNKFEPKKYRPIWRTFKFDQYFLHAFLQNFHFCSSHNLLNFHHLRVFLDFLEISICPLNAPFGFIFIEAFMLMYTSLKTYDFLLTFKRTYNVLTHNSQM